MTITTLVAITVHDPWRLVWRAWGLVFLGAVTGAAVVWVMRVPPRQVVREMGPPAEVPPPGRTGEPAHEGVDVRPEGQDGGGIRSDESVMAGELVDLLEAVPSDSLRYRIRRVLSDAGIVEYGADGEVFDPERHNVVDVESTDDPSRESRIARTVRPGFSDGARVIRPAEVLVYRGSRSSPTERPRRTVR
jgi:hypothetical protein